MIYLHFFETFTNPVTDEKYRVALSNVSATVFPSPFITCSTITFGSIFITNFSCFFFCFFMSEDFLSTLRANTFGKRIHIIIEIVMWNTMNCSIYVSASSKYSITWIEAMAFLDRIAKSGHMIMTRHSVLTPHICFIKDSCSLSFASTPTWNWRYYIYIYKYICIYNYMP